ncbi:MAG: DNA-protecting protein DprA [Planctomycetes bacterium]|nr:DNA-protecting protein DprA [Planctomycetota bacterium]
MDPHLLLALVEGFGPRPDPILLAPDLDVAATLATPPAPLGRAAQRRLRSPRLRPKAAEVLAAAARHGLTLLTPADPRFPPRLREAPLRPLVLFAKGNLELLASPGWDLTIVGSRTPTPYGEAAATDFAEELARAGCVLWSGLALGVDAIAHRAALGLRRPTVAVLAGGLDAIYPRQHESLAAQIVAEGGTLLSELPPGAAPAPGHFPRRNRILALAGLGVLVVEASPVSGSLITARLAAECGTPVFALPGPYTSARSRGCHQLLGEGARPAIDPEEVLRELLVGVPIPAGERLRIEMSADAVALHRALREGPRPEDLLQRELRLERARYLAASLALVEAGLAMPVAGGMLALRRSGAAVMPAPVTRSGGSGSPA